jgi:hypothetical protein
MHSAQPVPPPVLSAVTSDGCGVARSAPVAEADGLLQRCASRGGLLGPRAGDRCVRCLPAGRVSVLRHAGCLPARKWEVQSARRFRKVPGFKGMLMSKSKLLVHHIEVALREELDYRADKCEGHIIIIVIMTGRLSSTSGNCLRPGSRGWPPASRPSVWRAMGGWHGPATLPSACCHPV